MIDGRSSRAARAFLNWTARQLAAKSGVPMSLIFEFERNRPISEPQRRQIEAVFLQHGVIVVRSGSVPVGIRAASGGGGWDEDPAMLPNGTEQAGAGPSEPPLPVQAG